MRDCNFTKIISSKKRGFSLVEALLALAVFVLTVTAFVGSLYYGQENSVISGISSQAGYLAEEGLEAVRNMRDEDFSNLSEGTHGLAISGGVWNFSGSSDSTGIYTRSVEISEIDVYTKLAEVQVSWNYGGRRAGSVSIPTQLTNWQAFNPTQAEQLSVDVSNTEIVPGGIFYAEGINLENIGIEDIEIVSTEISWTGGSPAADLTEIIMDGDVVWTGTNDSGTSQDIDNFLVSLGGGIYPMELGFDSSINGITITIIFTMADGSTKQVSFSPGIAADIISPEAVSDLSVSSPTSSSLHLSWTAPGDDVDIGVASLYDIRYSTSTINDGNWSSATQVSGEPTPSIAGSSESMTVTGLTTGTTYYFAIKTSDEVPNVSNLSNVANGTTTVLPQASYLVVNTSSVALSVNKRDVLNMTLQNSGPSNITINSITVSWTGVAANRRMNFISMNGSTVWTGAVVSGVNNNITDVTISSGATIPINYFRFNNNVSGITLSVIFHMADGSTKSVSGIGPLP